MNEITCQCLASAWCLIKFDSLKTIVAILSRDMSHPFGESKVKSLILTAVAAMVLVAAGCADSVYDEQADGIRDQTQMEAEAVRENAQREANIQERNADVTADNLRNTQPEYKAEAEAVEEIGAIRADKTEEEAEVKADLIEAQGEAKADRLESLD